MERAKENRKNAEFNNKIVSVLSAQTLKMI